MPIGFVTFLKLTHVKNDLVPYSYAGGAYDKYRNKWYVHKPESVLEKETLKILCDFEIQTDHLISARRPDLVIVKKKKKKKKKKKVKRESPE